MDIRQLYYLHEVYRQKSYSKAANELHISQSNLSQQISKMESELGFKVFVHSKRSVIPTPSGLNFLEDSWPLLSQWESLLASTGRYALFNKTNLIIAMFPTVKYTPIIPLTDAFIKGHPNVVPEYQVMSEENVLASLKRGSCSIGFIEDAYTTPQGAMSRKTKDNLILTPISDDSIGVVLNAKDEMATYAVIRKNQLKNYQIICKKEGSKFTYERIRKIFMEVGVEIQRPYALTDDLDIVSSILRQSEGIFFTTYCSIGLAMMRNDAHLKCIPLDSSKRVVSYMAMRKEDADIPIVKKYFNYIEKQINYIQR